MGEIKLGDTAVDTITGYTGVVVCFSKWLNGCRRLTLQARELKDGKPVEAQTFDYEQLEVLSATVREPVRATGGDRVDVPRPADPSR